MSHFFRSAACSAAISPLSERKTSNPFTFARTAAPAPLSPPPNITIRLVVFILLLCFLLLLLSQCLGLGAGESFASYPRPSGLPPGAISLPFGRGYVSILYLLFAVVISMFVCGSRRIVRFVPPVHYLIFNSARVATARIRPTSQKRVTIFASGIGCDGHLIFAGMSIFW